MAILLLHFRRVCTCRFAYLMKFICNPQISSRRAFAAICGQKHVWVKNYQSLNCPADAKTLSCLFQLLICRMGVIFVVFSDSSLTFLCFFFLWFSCLKFSLSVMSKYCLVLWNTWRLWHMLQGKYISPKPWLGMSYSTVDCENSVNKSTTCI